MALKLVETFPQNKEHLHTYCVVGLYILTLLVAGYKFDEHTWNNIHFSQKVKKKSPVEGSCRRRPWNPTSVRMGTSHQSQHHLQAFPATTTQNI